jgi:hypothetical protein
MAQKSSRTSGSSSSPKILYKYRALEPWEYFLDALVNDRLYAATFDMLNDPMEGMFTYAKDQVSPGFIQRLVEKQSQLRICSLSNIYNSSLMWSYYSEAHKGVILGVEVDENHKDVIEVASVKYAKTISFRAYGGSSPEIDARMILSKKYSAWKHEREVRVFSHKQYIPVRLQQLFLGVKMPREKQRLVKNLLKRMNSDVLVRQMKREDLDAQEISDII